MYRIAGSTLSLIVAAAICSLPAFVLDSQAAENWAGGEAAAICEVGADIDQPMLIDHPMLLAAYTEESPHVAGKTLPSKPGDPGADRSPGAGAAPPNTMLSLMQPGPRPPQVAARSVDEERPEDWIRAAESTVPEPSLWAMLIAGFLGVCAMARRRIISS